jgi:hypothetical protein
MISRIALVSIVVPLVFTVDRSCDKPRVVYRAAVSCVWSQRWPIQELYCKCTPFVPYDLQMKDPSRWKYRWNVDDSIFSSVVENGHSIRLVIRPDASGDLTTVGCMVEIDEARVAYGSISLFIER